MDSIQLSSIADRRKNDEEKEGRREKPRRGRGRTLAGSNRHNAKQGLMLAKMESIDGASPLVDWPDWLGWGAAVSETRKHE